MVKFNDPDNTIVGNVGNQVGGLWGLQNDSNIESAGASLEDKAHPWLFFPKAVTNESCLYFNTDGWGPDFGEDTCVSSVPGATVPTLPEKYYRWGIFVGGNQQWYGIW